MQQLLLQYVVAARTHIDSHSNTHEHTPGWHLHPSHSQHTKPHVHTYTNMLTHLYTHIHTALRCLYHPFVYGIAVTYMFVCVCVCVCIYIYTTIYICTIKHMYNDNVSMNTWPYLYTHTNISIRSDDALTCIYVCTIQYICMMSTYLNMQNTFVSIHKYSRKDWELSRHTCLQTNFYIYCIYIHIYI